MKFVVGSKGANKLPPLSSVDEVGDIEGGSGFTVVVGEAIDLILGDGVGVVLTTAGKHDWMPVSCGSVVGACEGDDEGGLIGGAIGRP